MLKVLFALVLLHGNRWTHDESMTTVQNFASLDACREAGERFKGESSNIGWWCFETANPAFVQTTP